MENKNYNSKFVFIPGWMSMGKIYGYENSLDIWTSNINPEKKVETQYLVGHSAGALFALLNWDANRNTKLILVGPMIPKRSVLSWLIRWGKFILTEGTHMPFGRIKLGVYFISGTLRLLKLIQLDSFNIMRRVPRENIIVVRGKQDNYLCDDEVVSLLKENDIPVIEVNGLGHDWNERASEVVEKLTQGDAKSCIPKI